MRASPSWNARTEVCLETSRRSARGAMIGIVNAACPDPETTKKLKIDWNTYISTAASVPDKPTKAWEIPFKIVLSTVGSVAEEPPRTSMIPCAIPTTIAAPTRSAAPCLKDEAISLSLIPLSLNITPITPETSPITKNWEAISGM